MSKKKELEFNLEFRYFLHMVLPEYIQYVYEYFNLPKNKKEYPTHYKNCKYARKILKKLTSYYGD